MSQSPVQIVNAKASAETKASPGGKADAEKHPKTPFNAVLMATKALLNEHEAKSPKQQSGKKTGKESAPAEGKKTGKEKGREAGVQPDGARKKGKASLPVDGSIQQSPVIVVTKRESAADAAQAGKTSLEGGAAEGTRSGQHPGGAKIQFPAQTERTKTASKTGTGKDRVVSGGPAQKGRPVPEAASERSKETGPGRKTTPAGQRQRAAFESPNDESPLYGKAKNGNHSPSLAAGEQAKEQVRKPRGAQAAVDRARQNDLQDDQELALSQRPKDASKTGSGKARSVPGEPTSKGPSAPDASSAKSRETDPGRRATPARQHQGAAFEGPNDEAALSRKAKNGKGQKTPPGQHAQSAAHSMQTQQGPSQQAKQQAISSSQGASKAEAAAPPPPSTSSDGGTSADADTSQEGSPFSSKSGQTHSAQTQLGAAKSEGGASSQRLRRHWVQTLRAKTLHSSEMKGGWKQLKLQLPGEDGTMQLMAKRGDQQMAVSVGFSDPALRSLMQGQVEQMRQALQVEYDAPVDFSLMNGDKDQNEPGKERSAANRSGGQPAPNNERTASDAGDNERSPLQRRTLSNHEWIG